MKSENPEQNESKCDNFEPELIDAIIAGRLIERPAITDQELADELGISRQTANRRKNGPGVRELLAETLRLPEALFRRLTVIAVDRLIHLLNDPDPKIRLAATLTVLKHGASLMTKD